MNRSVKSKVRMIALMAVAGIFLAVAFSAHGEIAEFRGYPNPNGPDDRIIHVENPHEVDGWLRVGAFYVVTENQKPQDAVVVLMWPGGFMLTVGLKIGDELINTATNDTGYQIYSDMVDMLHDDGRPADVHELKLSMTDFERLAMTDGAVIVETDTRVFPLSYEDRAPFRELLETWRKDSAPAPAAPPPALP